MTPQERARKIAQLRSEGYTINEQTFTITPPQGTRRQTLVEGANTQNTRKPDPKIYRHGDYLREKLSGAAWHELADRSRPLPDGISAKYLLKEFSQLLAGIIEDNYV